jgi:hypothetical protein
MGTVTDSKKQLGSNPLDLINKTFLHKVLILLLALDWSE